MSREQKVAGHSHGEAEVMWRKAAVKLKGMREKGKGERERRDRRTIKGYGGGGRRRCVAETAAGKGRGDGKGWTAARVLGDLGR